MTQKILALAFGLLVSASASAQEYGLTLGFNQSTASVDNGTGVSGSIDGKLGFTGGLSVAFELVPALRFRTGLLYTQRQVDYKLTSPSAYAGKYQLNFAQLDVPINAQYNFNPMVGVFGGLIVGIKGSDSTKAPAGYTLNVDMKSLYPLIDVGANFTFDDMIGFDLYLEHGIGEFASSGGTSFKDYNTFGLRFIYWL